MKRPGRISEYSVNSGVEAKMANDALKIVTHDSAEAGKRPLGRTGIATQVDSVDPSKLMDMLGDIDSLKREIQDRMRRIEAVKQAKSLLLEDAMRTEALNKRLAEIGKVMSAVGFLPVDAEDEVASGLRVPGREAGSMAEARPAPVLVVHEGAAIPWPKTEEVAVLEAPVPHAEIALETPEVWEMGAAAELTVAEAPEIAVEEAVAEVADLELAAFEPMASPAMDEPASALSIAEILKMPVVEEPAQAEVEAPVELEPNAGPVAEGVAEYTAGPAQELSPEFAEEAAVEVGLAELEVAEPAIVEPAEEPEPAAYLPGRAEELVAEARRLLEESSARLDVAVQREEQAAEEFRATEESLATAYQSATAQLTEAERFWRLADEAATEAKRLFDESTAQLTVAVSKEQQSAADFHSAQQALTAAYQAASQRLESAEQFSKAGEEFAQETRKLLERMETELGRARADAQAANGDLLSARQELTTAYQFASVAAQRRLDSAEFFQKTASWVVFSSALAWIAAVWMAWVAFNRVMPLAVPFAASCVILAAAIFIRKRGVRALEEA